MLALANQESKEDNNQSLALCHKENEGKYIFGAKLRKHGTKDQFEAREKMTVVAKGGKTDS